MTNRWTLHIAFLLCFSTTALSIDYKQLQFRQSTSIRTCQKLLRQLNGRLNLSYRTDFKIPMEVMHPSQMEKSYTAFAIQVMLQNVFLVFRSNFSSTGWNETIVESLLDELHQQTEFLETILKEKQEDWRCRSVVGSLASLQDTLGSSSNTEGKWILRGSDRSEEGREKGRVKIDI